MRAQVDPAIGDIFEAPAAAPQDRGRLPVPGPVPATPVPPGATADQFRALLRARCEGLHGVR